MNRQPPRRSILHILLSTLARKDPEQAKQHIQLPPRPALDDRDAWHVYWKEQGQPWRAEPEIDTKRQKYLAERRVIPPDIERGIYPFKGVKLSRADIEWLLATHENGRGPVDWQDIRQRTREGLDLRGVDLRNVDLHNLPLARTRTGLKWLANLSEWLNTTAELLKIARIHLEGANLREAHLEGAQLINADLADAYLVGAYLNEANLSGATLEDAYLVGAHVEDANLTGAYLVSTNLRNANLSRANLTGAFFDPVTELENAVLGEKELGFAFLADISWGGTDLTAIDWSLVNRLGDESKARQQHRLSDYFAAVRANRQLSIVLRDQGLNEDAARFAYRAQVLQKTVFRLQMVQSSIFLKQRLRSFGAWLFSWFLFLLAGYGYKLWRSFVAYLLVISFFMLLYHVIDPSLAWNEAFVVSMTAFHGRGFSPTTFAPGDPLSFASAAEAFVGLVIEVTLIATLTQRFFGK
jgi:uncharacterized protein YjbI with pentapeptide repeats